MAASSDISRPVGTICTAQAPLLDWTAGIRVKLEITGPWRYFSAFRCGPHQHQTQGASRQHWRGGAVCLLFKNDVVESFVGVATSSDAVHFHPGFQRVVDATWKSARMTHNLAIAGPTGPYGPSRSFLLVGGQFNKDRKERGERPGPPNDGVWLARWPVASAAAALELQQAAGSRGRGDDSGNSGGRGSGSRGTRLSDGARRLFNGSHPGCVERRRKRLNLHPGSNASDKAGKACEFDGRLSLVNFRRRWLLYARANPTARGHRYVQLTSSDDRMSAWRPFQMITIKDYGALDGDLYFFSVFNNPVDANSLVAIFPLIQRGEDRSAPVPSCIGISASLDGLSWSPMTPLARCPFVDPLKERALCHPAGLIGSAADSGNVLLYIHNSVPAPDRYGPGTKRSNSVQPPASLTMHPIRRVVLKAWTKRALASI